MLRTLLVPLGSFIIAAVLSFTAAAPILPSRRVFPSLLS